MRGLVKLDEEDQSIKGSANSKSTGKRKTIHVRGNDTAVVQWVLVAIGVMSMIAPDIDSLRAVAGVICFTLAVGFWGVIEAINDLGRQPPD